MLGNSVGFPPPLLLLPLWFKSVIIGGDVFAVCPGVADIVTPAALPGTANDDPDSFDTESALDVTTTPGEPDAETFGIEDVPLAATAPASCEYEPGPVAAFKLLLATLPGLPPLLLMLLFRMELVAGLLLVET